MLKRSRLRWPRRTCAKPRASVSSTLLDQSALLEVLEALKAADVGDRIRTAAETIYQDLIEPELIAVIGAAPHERSAVPTYERRTPARCRCSWTSAYRSGGDRDVAA
jgi:hypothetical protein